MSSNHDHTDYALIIEDLNYSINQTDILKNINLKIKKGELVGFVGPNGAGKTTLLKCINGINRSKGYIELNGSSIKQMDSREIARKAALMYQNTTITFPFPAMDVVLFGRYPHLKRLESENKNDYLIARKNMEFTDTLKLERNPITEISGGERQRILFAKVLTQETDLILLDEPTASLDISHQEQIFKYARELCNTGKTVITAVHDLKIASRYCSRMVLMKEGEIIADGPPDKVLTSSSLSCAYGVNALVYRSRVTGFLDFYIHGMEQSRGTGTRVHVIGGGGSASGIIRQLFEKGYKVTAGVFPHGDSDLQCAEIFGIECIACEPFSEISDDELRKNIENVKNARVVILCNMPFGVLNCRNLEAAKHAESLIIIENDFPENRDYTGGKAIELYNELKKNAVVTSSARLHEVLVV